MRSTDDPTGLAPVVKEVESGAKATTSTLASTDARSVGGK